jgi:hypothetical protein
MHLARGDKADEPRAARIKVGPTPAQLQNRDRGGRELRPHAVQGRATGRCGSLAAILPGPCCQHQDQVREARIVADEQPGAGGGRQPADEIEQAVRGRPIDRRLEDCWRLVAEFGLCKLPCLASAPGCRTHDVIRNKACLPEPASCHRRVSAASGGKRPIVIRDILGPR